jgi:hypothetical protein
MVVIRTLYDCPTSPCKRLNVTSPHVQRFGRRLHGSGGLLSRSLVALQFGKRRAVNGHSDRRGPQGHFMGGDIGQAEFAESRHQSLGIQAGRGGQHHALTGRFSDRRDEIATLRGLCPQCRPFGADARRSCPGRSCRRGHRLLLGECWRRRGNRSGVGLTRRVVQRGRSYRYYYDRCMAR